MTDYQETFSINLGGDAKAEAGAISDEMARLKSSIEASQSTIRNASAAMRLLKGSSAEVTSAKAQLRAKIDAERSSITQSQLSLMKQGTTYDQLASRMKRVNAERAKATAEIKKGAETKETDRLKGLNSVISYTGGPLAAMRDRIMKLRETLAGSSGSLGLALGITTMAIGGLFAVIGKLGSVFADASVGLVTWIVRSADAARNVRLFREAAFGGNAQWGRAFGSQVDELARKVATPKEKLNELGRELAKENIGGKTWVHTLNAMTQASEALGDSAGAKIKGFVERGKLLNNFQLNPQELVGTGVTFDEVARALAHSTKKGVTDAKQALLDGRVKLEDGALALRRAVENRFGGLNLEKSISLDSLSNKFKENLMGLTKDVNLEPILKALKSIVDVFDSSTVSGKALKQMVEVIAEVLGAGAAKGTPIFKQFIYGLILGAQNATITFLTLAVTLKKVFRNTETIDGINAMTLAVNAGKLAFAQLQGAILIGAISLATFLRVVNGIASGVNAINSAITGIRNAFTADAWKLSGSNVVNGLADGITAGVPTLIKAIKSLANSAKDAFKDTLQIHSPSRVFEKFGEQTTEGYARGVDRGAAAPTEALERMAASFGAAVAGGISGGGAPSVSVALSVHAGSGDANEIARAVSDRNVLDALTRAIVDALRGKGAPVPT